jgi:hypothetical protein
VKIVVVSYGLFLAAALLFSLSLFASFNLLQNDINDIMWIYIKMAKKIFRFSSKRKKFHFTNLKIKAKSSFISSASLMENYSFRLKWDALDTFFFFSFPPLIFHFFVFPEFSFPFFISRRSHFIKLCYRLKSVWSIKGNFCDFGGKNEKEKRKSRRKLWFDGGKIFANRKQLRRRREKKQENYGEIVFFVW